MNTGHIQTIPAGTESARSRPDKSHRARSADWHGRSAGVFAGGFGGRPAATLTKRASINDATYRNGFHRVPILLAALLLAALAARAQTLTQTFTLQKGWNAIYLEVTPLDGDPATLFAEIPVESVWTRLDRLSSVDFIQNPAEPVFNEASWLRWFAPPRPAFVNDLRQIQGRRAYLVNLLKGPAVLRVTGEPALRSIQWAPDAWNLRGFPVASNQPPTFRSYFQSSTNHYDTPQDRLRGAYRLGPDGVWAPASPDARMRAGEACWVYCQGASSFTGPFEVKLGSGEMLDFSQELDRLSLQFLNLSSGFRTVTISQSGAIPGLLAYQRFHSGTGPEWADLPNPFIFTVTNGSPENLSLAIRRSRMPDTNYGSILDISDNQGTRYALPVTAQRFGLNYAGLWVGSVSVNAVSQPHFGSLVTNLYALVNDQATLLTGSGLVVTTNLVVSTNSDLEVTTNAVLVAQTTDGVQVPVYEKVERDVAAQSPTPTKGEFTMRLLIHVNAAGESRLLKEVVQMWRDGTYTTDAEGRRVLDKPGSYVLLTRDNLLGQFKGATLRNGVPVGRRLSAIGFDFEGHGTNDMALSGTFGPAHTLTGQIRIGSDHPLNPFRHQYHPDHDNLDLQFEPITDPERKEAYAVTRVLQLEFAAAGASNSAHADPAYSSMEGIYHETLTGLHKQPLLVQGTFRLSRASFISELNPNPTP